MAANLGYALTLYWKSKPSIACLCGVVTAYLCGIFFHAPGNYWQRISGGNPTNVTNCDGSVWFKNSADSPGNFGYIGSMNGYVANAVNGICSLAQPLHQREHYHTTSDVFAKSLF